MEEKIFLMLEKIHSELQEVKSEAKENTQRLIGIEERLGKLEVKVDHEVLPKINGLFDGYTQNAEIINKLESKVDYLTDEVKEQELEIRVIKGGK